MDNRKRTSGSQATGYDARVASSSPADLLVPSISEVKPKRTVEGADVTVGSAVAAYRHFNPEDQPGYRPGGVVADTGKRGGAFENGARATGAGAKVLGLHGSDALIIGLLGAAAVAAAVLSGPVLAVGLAATTVCLAIDAAQHRDDDSTLLDRPGSVIKAGVVGVTSALTFGAGAKAILFSAAAVTLTETLLDDNAEIREVWRDTGVSIKTALQDGWLWLKVVCVGLVVFLMSRRSVPPSGGRAAGSRLSSVTRSAINDLKRLIRNK